MSQQSNHLEVPGASLYYEVRGSGPLLLVVGQPMTSAPFGPLADLLASDHTVVTYDPRGLGGSTITDPSADVTPEIEADDLAALIDAMGAERADVVASSGGAVAGLALAARHPDKVATLVAHEPPVTELVADAEHVRRVVDEIDDAFRTGGSGAAWGRFVGLVMHDGPVTTDGVAAASFPPAGAPDGHAGDQDHAPPSAKQQADDELFFLRMLKPFTRYQPLIGVLRDGGPRVVIGVGETSGGGVARRSADALAERLGTTPTVFPGDHGGFASDPESFATKVREVL